MMDTAVRVLTWNLEWTPARDEPGKPVDPPHIAAA